MMTALDDLTPLYCKYW